LTGGPPFDGTQVLEVLRRVISEPPTPPRKRNPDVPVELEAICLRGLSKDREARQQSASEIADNVRSWIAERADRKRSEQERERFFALSPDLLGVVDEAGRLQQSNPAWERITGRTAQALPGASFPDLLTARDGDAMRQLLRDVIATGHSASAENRLLHADGSHRWIDWSASRIADERLVYLVGRDVTQRRHDEQRFHGLLESAPDAMVVIDETARIVFANGQANRIFGYEEQELIGQPIEVVVPERFRADHPAKVRAFIDQPAARPMGARLELFGRRKDGTEFPAEVSLSPVRTETGLLVCSAVRDVTDRRRAQRLCEALLESAPDAMVVTDDSGTIKLANSEATKLFGYTAAQLVGQRVEMLVPPEVRQQHPQFFAGY
ncbi:MAG: hypothetical protein B7Z55_16845, partial [Planctomycetales bacterium 12-60-4]